ncbi:MAG: type II toxin-antitoxin system RelE/ParE family toxin [Desulfitobacteriaceae bacterium]|nr:type II toxin-antitoxin system RelE/ParE family toxin [Desulfitobacteriaceae bacterium]MDI6878975.1 type II toxin-antitoxin system RelE/ParE family toxin [Desulfitobacteriaceae bacterium]MDI6916154.1 type II toxin-antitoxin system RelE/ParE family toxin [Desulfitobacteriaceae bacterium]
MYKLKYLPLAQKDLRNITNYIADNLKAPKAAMDLVDAFEQSIHRLQQFPYSCQLYQSIQPLEAEYRMLNVKQYLVFYVVTAHEVEIHRIIYAKMDITNLIK